MENTDQSPLYPQALALLALDAHGPLADNAEQLMLYGQFVGSWAVRVLNFQADGAQTEWQGAWHFAWILGGRGVQDVLCADGAPAHRFGTTLRCYDSAINAWRVTWMAPSSQIFVNLIGRKVDDRIVQEGTASNRHVIERWTFSDITPTTFIWQGEVSSDQGKTWTLEQEIQARRLNE